MCRPSSQIVTRGPIRPTIPPDSRHPLLIQCFVSDYTPCLLLIGLPAIVFPGVLYLGHASYSETVVPNLVHFVSPLELITANDVAYTIVFPPFRETVSATKFELVTCMCDSSGMLFSGGGSKCVAGSVFRTSNASS